MNRSKSLITTLIGILLILSACSGHMKNNGDLHETPSAVLNNGDFPLHFSSSSVKAALEEKINYHLWFYPLESDFGFTPYIGDTFKTEVRFYESDPDSVYIQMEKVEWLAKIVYSNGIVYCDGFLIKEQKAYFPEGDYVVVESFTIDIKQPRKPNYGESPRKDRMIAAVESAVHAMCEDFLRGSGAALWRDAKITIIDFYEYENGVSVWFTRKDGYASYSPFQVMEKNDQFVTEGLKGYGIDNVDSLDWNHMYAKQTFDAVAELKCPGSLTEPAWDEAEHSDALIISVRNTNLGKTYRSLTGGRTWLDDEVPDMFVTMDTAIYPHNVEQIPYTIYNNRDRTAITGIAFRLFVWNGNGWTTTTADGFFHTEEGYPIEPNESLTLNCNLRGIKLEAGKYILEKSTIYYGDNRNTFISEVEFTLE